MNSEYYWQVEQQEAINGTREPDKIFNLLVQIKQKLHK